MIEDQRNTEIEQKKRYLKRYRKNKACIRRLEDKVTRLDERIKAIRSPNYSGMPRGGIPVTIDDLISDKTELEDRIKRLKARSKGIRSEILAEIDTLEDPRHSLVLEAFCIECKSLEDIADEEGYNERHVRRLYSEAIRVLAQS